MATGGNQHEPWCPVTRGDYSGLPVIDAKREPVEEMRAGLRAVMAIPSGHDLLTNAVARAMYEVASRTLGYEP